MNIKFYSPDGPQAGQSGGLDHPSGSYQKKGYPLTLNGETLWFTNPIVTGDEILEAGHKLPLTCFSLYIKKKGCDFDKISLNEKVDIADKEVEHFITKEPESFPYAVNGQPELTEEKSLTATAIITLAGLNAEQVYLVQILNDKEEKVYAYTPNESIRLHCAGSTFVTREWVAEIDIEEYGKTCKPVTPARVYIIKVDKDKFKWNQPTIKAEELIRFVVKETPANFTLIKFYSNTPKPVPVPFTAIIDLTEKCLLRFVVQPKTQNDGLNRDFTLPEVDREYLEAIGFRWEAHKEANYLWLLIHDYPVPDGYHVNKCTIALMIPPGYPASEIDMAYFHPQLVKNSGRGIAAISSQPINQQNFQRWSRHRRGGEWKPGIDCVATHLLLVNNWLENELSR